VRICYVNTGITLEEKDYFLLIIYVVRKDKHGEGKGEMMLRVQSLGEERKYWWVRKQEKAGQFFLGFYLF
jgi:hypothetical protein